MLGGCLQKRIVGRVDCRAKEVGAEEGTAISVGISKDSKDSKDSKGTVCRIGGIGHFSSRQHMISYY